MLGVQRYVSMPAPFATSESPPYEAGSVETVHVPVKLVPPCPLSRRRSSLVYVAVHERLSLIASPLPAQPASTRQPAKMDPGAAIAGRSATVPFPSLSLQSAAQS